MDLILWRHAEAEELLPGQNDLDRRLTRKGEKQARRIAKWFLANKPDSLRILVSPATRAQQTAAALGLPFKLERHIAPEADVADLIAASGWPHRTGTTLLVGHQPSLGELAARLMTGSIIPWRINKGAVWWFRTTAIPTEHQSPKTQLLAVIDSRLIGP